ncbi:ABC transporter permease [Actinomyces oris]|uniref:Uncharacterized protein n=1 Tax=Actinomyces oris TaxID=544580 RepID=A0A1Q8V5A3_9ACTO|nr:ABC transporter permease [Actinomyces oris]OLO43332.1 hypothetical protein BKH29_10970 [Actinomyces oris]
MSTPVSTGGPAATMAAQPTSPTQHLTQPPTQPAAPLELPVSALRSARTTLALELGKLRRKRYWLIAASATAVCLAWSSLLIIHRASGPAEARHATLALNEFIQIIAFLMPIITAVLASRIVTVDTEERMGQLMTALGQSPLTRYRGKLVIVILTILCMEASIFALLSVLAGSIGLTVTDSYWRTLPPALVVVACSTLAISAVQLTLSTCFDKQGIGLGVAAIGGLIAESLPYAYLGKFSWLLPWGIVPAATPIDTVASYKSMREGGDMTLVSQPWTLAALAALVAVGWTVAAHLVIVHQENHR